MGQGCVIRSWVIVSAGLASEAGSSELGAAEICCLGLRVSMARTHGLPPAPTCHPQPACPFACLVLTNVQLAAAGDPRRDVHTRRGGRQAAAASIRHNHGCGGIRGVVLLLRLELDRVACLPFMPGAPWNYVPRHPPLAAASPCSKARPPCTGLYSSAEGIGINRLTQNFTRAQVDHAFKGTDREAVEMVRGWDGRGGRLIAAIACMHSLVGQSATEHMASVSCAACLSCAVGLL